MNSIFSSCKGMIILKSAVPLRFNRKKKSFNFILIFETVYFNTWLRKFQIF